MAKKHQPRTGGENRKHKHAFSSKGASRGGRGPASPAGSAKRSRPESSITPNRRHGFAGGERPYDYAFYESEPATPEYMARLFAKHDFPVDDRQLSRFWKYYELLREHNASLDLTRIMGIEATVLKHFIDSAIILRWFKPTGPVLDIGSGPGFPGAPIAVMRPDLQVILAESRGKRVGFLEKVIETLGLKNVEIFPRSVREDSPLGEDYGKPVGDVVTRALEAIPPTLERILPIVRAGGQIAFLKGPDCEDEIQQSLSLFKNAYSLERDVLYTLPGSEHPRRLVLFRRISHF